MVNLTNELPVYQVVQGSCLINTGYVGYTRMGKRMQAVTFHSTTFIGTCCL